MPPKKTDGLTKYDRYRLKNVEGYRARKAEWARTESQRQKRTAYMRIWRSKNRERHNQLARESYRRHASKISQELKDVLRYKQYGLTPEQVETMLVRQNHRCAICQGERDTGRRLHVDHCHKSGAVRGLLCPRCNSQLGWFEKIGVAAIEAYLNGQSVTG